MIKTDGRPRSAKHQNHDVRDLSFFDGESFLAHGSGCCPANVQATTATSRSSNGVVQPSGQNIIEFEVMGSQLMG